MYSSTAVTANNNWTPSPSARSNNWTPSPSARSTRLNPHSPPEVLKTVANPYAKGRQSSQSQPVTPSTASSHSTSNGDGAYAPGFTIPSVGRKEAPKLEVSSLPNNHPRSPSSKSQLSVSNKFMEKLEAAAEEENTGSFGNADSLNISSQQMAPENKHENINDTKELKQEEIRDGKNSTNESPLCMDSLENGLKMRRYKLHQKKKKESSDHQLPVKNSPILNSEEVDHRNEEKQYETTKGNARKKDGWLVEDSGSEGMEALNMIRALVGKTELPPEAVQGKKRSKRNVLCDSDDEEVYQSANHHKKKQNEKSDDEDDDSEKEKHAKQRKLNRSKRMRAKYPRNNPFVLDDCSEAPPDYESVEPSTEDLSSDEEVYESKDTKKKAAQQQKKKSRTEVNESEEDEYIDVEEMVRKHVITLKQLQMIVSQLCLSEKNKRGNNQFTGSNNKSAFEPTKRKTNSLYCRVNKQPSLNSQRIWLLHEYRTNQCRTMFFGTMEVGGSGNLQPTNKSQ